MTRTPSISVVICTRNRPQALAETLASIWPQSRRPDELILIDDGDLDAAVRDDVAAHCSRLGVRFLCEKNARPGLTPGRNLAARLATGDVLFYLDDDVTCRPDCIERVAALFADPAIAGVTATIEEPRFECSRSARLYQLGYRIAAWWRIAPRTGPKGPPPRILERPWVATRARWLSGAAMALRRTIVLEHPFDENLVEYALGEDREMGYRLASRYWLLESKLARVVHRRDGAARTENRRLGYMTVRNYLYILGKTCTIGVGERLLIAWSLFVVACMHLAWSLGPGQRGHFSSLWGMLEGLAASLRDLCAARTPRGTPNPRRGARPDIATPPLTIANSGRNATPPRNVLFVTNRLEPGGAELMLLALVKRLSAHGIRPHILCLKDGGPLAPECRSLGIPVYEKILEHRTDAAAICRIGGIIADSAIDAVVVAHSGGDRMFWATLAAALSGTPVVVWSHWFPLPNQHHFERANRALYRLVQVFVALGERQRQALIRHEYVPAGRIAVIPNAIELDRFRRHDVSRAEARRRLGLADDQIAVAIIANLRREKRHDVFIQAARNLAPRDARLRFLVIGDGPGRDAVQSCAAASGLDPEVLRLLGPRSDIVEILPAIDISCLCSDQECFSVTMLEAAAAGVPFIGPDSGCMPEFLEHRKTGLLIEPADPIQLAEAIAELARDSDLRTAIADAARRKVLIGYGIEKMSEAFADLLRATAAAPSSSAQIDRDRPRRLPEFAAV